MAKSRQTDIDFSPKVYLLRHHWYSNKNLAFSLKLYWVDVIKKKGTCHLSEEQEEVEPQHALLRIKVTRG